MAFNVVTMVMRAGMDHFAKGRMVEAESMFRQAVGADPRQAEGFYMLGKIARAKGQWLQAADMIAKAVQIDSSVIEWQLSLGEIQVQLKQFAAAAVTLGALFERSPRDVRVGLTLVAAMVNERRFAEALAIVERCAMVAPGDAEVQSQWGVVWGGLRERERAVEHFQRAVKLAPGIPKYLWSLGVGLLKLGRAAEALERAEEALRIEPANAPRQLDYALMLLTLGRYKEGWAAYESRPAVVELQRAGPRRIWGGEAVESVLLAGEQGFGDVIQFVRYARLAAARGIRAGVVCQKPLSRLLRNVEGVSAVHDSAEGMLKYESMQYLMGLPRVFGTKVETIPWDGPYVLAEEEVRARWAEKVRAAGAAKLRVGLVWAGNPLHVNDADRSIGLAAMKPLSEVEGSRFFSLQAGAPGTGVAGAAGGGFPLTDLTGEFADFAETAGLVANLDLVICVDTSVAHLAGAMGKQVWTLLPLSADWRWMLEREDSPWYPTMRLFRQIRTGEWGPVVERVRRELTRVVSGLPMKTPPTGF